MKQALYSALPEPLQHVAVSAEGLRVRSQRLGGDFQRRLQSYLRAERASEGEVLDVRRHRLRRILEHAARTIPHWRTTFSDAGLDPSRVEGPDDLRVLPILSKADVLRLGDALRWRDAHHTVMAHTAGTTGAGLVFPVSSEAVRDQWALWWRFRMRHGLELHTWSATFTGRPIVPRDLRTSRPWRINRPGRQVLFSQYHLGPQTAHLYLRHLEHLQLPWFHGYPSVIALLATLGIELDATHGIRPRVVTLGAENVLASQVRVISEAFAVRPVQHYGMAEGVANASECTRGRLHVDEDFAAVELLPHVDGTVRILGTSFENLAMPLIRYDTGDVARVAPGGCDCGLPGRVLESIDGRQEDLLALADGSRVGRVDHLFKDMERIAEAQIRQTEPGRCTIVIVPRGSFGSADEARLLAECEARFGARLEVAIELVGAIPRTRSGKLRMVVSEAAPLQPARS